LVAEEEDMMVLHKDLRDQRLRYPPGFPLDLGIKIGTRTEMVMPLRSRVWITVALPRMVVVVRGRRRGNRKIVDMAGNVVCHQAWMTVADLKGVELSYHVYDTFFF